MHGNSFNQAAVFQGIAKKEEPTLIMVKIRNTDRFLAESGEKNGLKLTADNLEIVSKIFEVTIPDGRSFCPNWNIL